MNARLASVVILALALAASLASCKKRDPVYDQALLVAGSTTMEAYLDPVVEAFAKKYGASNVVCDPGGAGAGVVALKRGAIDVAMVARDLTNDEDDFSMRNYLVARDGIAIVVHPSNPIGSLTMKQLHDVFTGSIRNWEKVGGSPGPLRVLVHEKDARVRKSFGDLVMRGHDLAEDAQEVEPTRFIDVLDLDPGAIGYVAFKDASKNVKSIKVEGVEMTRSTLLSARYPLARSFYLALYNPTAIAERFVAFAISKEGQALLAESGLVPLYF